MKKMIFKLLPLFFITPVFAVDHPTFENFEERGDYIGINDVKSFELTAPKELGVKVDTTGFTARDTVKLYKAVQILKEVMNSKQLRDLILNYSYNGDQVFHQNNGMSNLEIYKHLMTGAEDIKPEQDQIMDFKLVMYRSLNPWSKVKGYTKPGTLKIWIHSKFYRRSNWTPIDVAANMAHEWVHKMGFGHDYYYNQDRPYSVPYAIGGLVAQVAEKMGY